MFFITALQHPTVRLSEVLLLQRSLSLPLSKAMLRFITLLALCSATTLSMYDLPPTVENVWLDIGSNLDPFMPPPNEAATTVTIAFEPIVADKIRPQPGLYVVPAAVSADSALSMMNLFNAKQTFASSSLGSVATSASWTADSQRAPAKLVPVLSMRVVLDNIPSTLNIPFLKTDMQGARKS